MTFSGHNGEGCAGPGGNTMNAICDACQEPARFHYGCESPDDAALAIQAHASGERFLGRRYFPGDTIHLCGDHALALRRSLDREEAIRMFRIGV